MDEKKESPLDNYVSKKEKDEKITLSSRKKLFWLGITIALLNPVFSGLILGFVFWTEPELKKEAKIILVLSLVWGIGLVYFSNWLIGQGYLPYQP